jgi:predicted secreted hydrolase
MGRNALIFIVPAVLAIAVAFLASSNPAADPVADPEGFRVVDGPCDLRFPEDHGPHPDHKTEWWYYTGNLRDERGADYGFQLTFFRSRIVSPVAEARWPEPRSAWRTAQIFLAHAAVSDIDGGRFFQADRVARGTLDIAGAVFEREGVRIHLRNWRVEIDGDIHRLRAQDPALAISLTLRSRKPPVPHGQAGYSRKGEKAESASCYYSLTRMAAEGTLSVGPDGGPVSVTGLAWMDHEFSSAPLEANLEGWDWFSLQLDDETELMAYLLRREDGSPSPVSSATLIAGTRQVPKYRFGFPSARSCRIAEGRMRFAPAPFRRTNGVGAKTVYRQVPSPQAQYRSFRRNIVGAYRIRPRPVERHRSFGIPKWVVVKFELIG